MSAGIRPGAAVGRITRASRRSATLGAAVDGCFPRKGEPDAGTPPAVVGAAMAALKNGRTRYAPMTGGPPFAVRSPRMSPRGLLRRPKSS